MTTTVTQSQSARDYIAQRETLRLCTAGSVDDGKSTFVGRLLHDTKSVLADQLDAVARTSKDRGFDGLDLSLLVDGLRAEREQGITIDVAYRYFATDKRTFILADTPGHVQYTRNTVTGVSTSQVVVVLIDVRHGVVEQTRRHMSVAALLGVRTVILAVNKIDLVDYDEQAFREIEEAGQLLARTLGIPNLHVVPISALKGDNVVAGSDHMDWYTGPTVLELLETLPVGDSDADTFDFRFPIQYVIREHSLDYRGYAGLIATGSIAVGDQVIVGQQRETTVVAIDSADGPLERAHAGQSVVLRLGHEFDLARGDLIAAHSYPEPQRSITATLVGLSEAGVRRGAIVKVRYGTQVVKGRIREIEQIIDIDTLGSAAVPTPGLDSFEGGPEQIPLNDIAEVSIDLAQPLPIEPYAARGAVGALLLIDPSSGDSLAAGLVGRKASSWSHS